MKQTYPHGRRANQAGFTIVELMIASAVFAIIMLILTLGILQISKTYYKGINQANTQDVARNVLNAISQDIQYGSGTPAIATTGNVMVMCIGSNRYTVNLNQELVDASPNAALHQTLHALLVDYGFTGCSDTVPDTAPTTATQELLAPHLRVSALDITGTPGGLYTIHIHLVFGEDDLLCSPTANNCSTGVFALNNDLICKSQEGSQFCAVSDLTTTVQKRIN